MAFKKELTEILDNIADLLELKGENPFKIGAYRKGANVLRNIDDIEELVKTGEIKNVKGIGKSLLSVITEFYQSGVSTDLMKLSTEFPTGILEFLKIRGLGASKIRLISGELNIKNLDELETACRDNKLSTIKGFGPKTEIEILKELERLKYSRNFLLQNSAELNAGYFLKRIKRFSSVKEAEVTGELRRKMELVSSIDIVVLVTNYTEFKDALTEQKLLLHNSSSNNKYISLKNYITDFEVAAIESDLPIPAILILTQNKNDYLKAFFLSTGSQEFIEKLNITLNDAYADEQSIFTTHKLLYIIPEMREEQYYNLPEKLRNNSELSLENYKGLLHFHTTFSDGRNSLPEMIQAAIDKRFQYLAVCDHSKAAFYANGLSEDRILEQQKVIHELSKKFKIPILRGLESDILKNGELDYDQDFLSNFDFIVASIHSRFKMEKEEMTARIIRAIENPYTDLIGHPTGRLLLSRDPYQVDIKKIIDACAANKVAIEINAQPQRLDLDWRYLFYAREKGCMFSINPDAHSISEIDFLQYGINTARKAGLQPEEVINFFDLNKFKTFLNRKISRF